LAGPAAAPAAAYGLADKGLLFGNCEPGSKKPCRLLKMSLMAKQ